MKTFQPRSIGNIPGLFPDIYGRTARPVTQSAMPTVSYSAGAIASAQAFNGTSGSGNDAPNAAFGVYGAYGAQWIRRATASPQYNALQTNLTGTNGNSNFTVCFYTTAKTFDIIHYGAGQSFDVWVDDVYLGHYNSSVRANTAQAGGASTITLDSGASATNGFYNTCYVRITGGTGVLGEQRRITAYVGSTKVATVDSAWTTPPDATTTFSVSDAPNSFDIDGLTGSIRYLNFLFASTTTRKITVSTSTWSGVNIGPNDSIWPGPPVGQLRAVYVGDSFLNTRAPAYQSTLPDQLGRLLGCQICQLGSGSTGWGAPAIGNGIMNYMDRICPPTESWMMTNSATGGTYTLSVTYGGSTQTTGALAYSASAATIVAALNGLSNVASNSASCGAGDAWARPLRVLLHNMPGATLVVNVGSLTGGTATLNPWLGDLAPIVPLDGNGNALPFLLIMQGSGNDAGGSIPDATVQANATYVAGQLLARFPTAIPIWLGVVSITNHGGATIDATDVAHNAALSAAAATWGTINGSIPFINTYANGIGGNAWIFGTGTVGVPTANKNDVLISLIAAGHPTGDGASYLAHRIAQNVKALLGKP